MFDVFGSIEEICNDSKNPGKALARLKNSMAFNNTFLRCINLAMHRYTIRGLPETIPARPLMRALLYHGGVIFFEREGGLFALPGNGASDVNVYGYAGSAYVHGCNGFEEKVRLALPGGAEAPFLRKNVSLQKMPESKQGVEVRENYMHYPFVWYCVQTAEAIADTMRTLDVARKNIKHPYIIAVEQSIINTVKSYFNSRDANEEYIIGSGVFPVDKIKMFPLDQNPECIKVATDLIEWYWNDFFELCGFNSNSNPDKKAQLTTVEVNANNDAIALQAAQVIDCINEDLDLVNKVYGTNIVCEKTDLTDYVTKISPEQDQEEDNHDSSDKRDKDVQ